MNIPCALMIQVLDQQNQKVFFCFEDMLVNFDPRTVSLPTAVYLQNKSTRFYLSTERDKIRNNMYRMNKHYLLEVIYKQLFFW